MGLPEFLARGSRKSSYLERFAKPWAGSGQDTLYGYQRGKIAVNGDHVTARWAHQATPSSFLQRMAFHARPSVF